MAFGDGRADFIGDFLGVCGFAAGSLAVGSRGSFGGAGLNAGVGPAGYGRRFAFGWHDVAILRFGAPWRQCWMYFSKPKIDPARPSSAATRKIRAARRALAMAVKVDDVRDIRDKPLAVRSTPFRAGTQSLLRGRPNCVVALNGGSANSWPNSGGRGKLAKGAREKRTARGTRVPEKPRRWPHGVLTKTSPTAPARRRQCPKRNSTLTSPKLSLSL